MPTKRKAPSTKRSPKKARKKSQPKSIRVTGREYLEILIKYTDLALVGSKEDEGTWLRNQSERLKKELKNLK